MKPSLGNCFSDFNSLLPNRSSRVANEKYERFVALLAQNKIDIDERIDSALTSLRSGNKENAIAYLLAKIERIESTIGSQDNKIVALEAIVIGLPTTFISTKQVEAIFDRAISPLLPRLEALETNLSEATATAKKATDAVSKEESVNSLETDALPIIEAIANIASPTIENPLPDESLSVAIAASAKPKITYQLGRDGLVVLRSLRGITLKALKRMTDAELKAIGLFRTLIGADEKFFPLDPDTIASSPQPKSTERSPKSKAILTRPDALAIAKNFGFLGTGQNLYDWAKAALTSKSEESKLANSEKLAVVGLVAAFTPENKPAWIAKVSLNPEPIS